MNQQVVSIVMLVGMLVLMYLLLIRPQRRQEKKVAEMRNSLKVGDEIITIGGFFAKVVRIKDEVVTLQFADGTKVEAAKWAISKVAEAADRKAAAGTPNAPAAKEEKGEEKKANAEAVRPKSLKKAERKAEDAEEEAK